MSAPRAASDTDPRQAGSAPRRERRRRLAWASAGAFALLVLGAWVYALFVYDPGLLVDELADRSFPRAAEARCARAEADLERLPRAETATSAAARAATIEKADAVLSSMVADLRVLAPARPAGASEAVNEWLDDWETHLRDRADYAERLRGDPDARFTETVKGAKQVSRAIDGYAQVNRMRSCETPGDVG